MLFRSVNTASNYTWTGVHTFNANVSLGASVLANNAMGANGQVLTSNGTATYWANGGGSKGMSYGYSILFGS